MESAEFRSWFRARRKALLHTQATLAEAVGCSISTIRKVEAGRLRPSVQITDLLIAALQLSAEEGALFRSHLRAIPTTEGMPELLAAAAADSGRRARSADLGQTPVAPTALVGRQQEMATLIALLQRDDVRLITLTGSPGSGKTRLALELARQIGPNFSAGVRFVALADVKDPGLVMPAIAVALGVKQHADRSLLADLRYELRDQTVLLVIDNFEQVIGAGEYLAALLAAIAGLKLLVTSREELSLRGERVFPVPPLELPDLEPDATLDDLAQVAAVALFVARAQDSDPEFRFTAENRLAVTAITHRLAGLPLAIELAAARSALLPPAMLLDHLASHLLTLSNGRRDLAERQRTLRNALGWSYSLLDEHEQLLFRRLSIFAGGWSFEAASAICATGHHPLALLDGLDSLRRKSLVQRDLDADTPRFRMLELVREFAGEQLEASGESVALAQAHAEYYLDLAETAARHFAAGEQRLWSERIERELTNLRAAQQWVWAQQQYELAERFAIVLAPFWEAHGHWSEGRRWLDLILGAPVQIAPTVRARLLQAMGVLASAQGDYPQAEQALRESEAFWRAAGDVSGLAGVLQDLGRLAVLRDALPTAALLLNDALALYRQVENVGGAASVLVYLGCQLYDQGEFARAEAMLREALDIFTTLHNEWGISHARYHLARLAFTLGDRARAEQLHRANLLLTTELRDEDISTLTLMWLSLLAIARGNYARAQDLAEQSLARARALGGRSYTAVALYCRGMVALHNSQIDKARAYCRESLRLLTPDGAPVDIAGTLTALAGVAAADGDMERAVRLMGAAEGITSHSHTFLDPICQAVQSGAVELARSDLGQDTFARLWNKGRESTLEDICRYALL